MAQRIESGQNQGVPSAEGVGNSRRKKEYDQDAHILGKIGEYLPPQLVRPFLAGVIGFNLLTACTPNKSETEIDKDVNEPPAAEVIPLEEPDKPTATPETQLTVVPTESGSEYIYKGDQIGEAPLMSKGVGRVEEIEFLDIDNLGDSPREINLKQVAEGIKSVASGLEIEGDVYMWELKGDKGSGLLPLVHNQEDGLTYVGFSVGDQGQVLPLGYTPKIFFWQVGQRLVEDGSQETGLFIPGDEQGKREILTLFRYSAEKDEWTFDSPFTDKTEINLLPEEDSKVIKVLADLMPPKEVLIDRAMERMPRETKEKLIDERVPLETGIEEGQVVAKSGMWTARLAEDGEWKMEPTYSSAFEPGFSETVKMMHPDVDWGNLDVEPIIRDLGLNAYRRRKLRDGLIMLYVGSDDVYFTLTGWIEGAVPFSLEDKMPGKTGIVWVLNVKGISEPVFSLAGFENENGEFKWTMTFFDSETFDNKTWREDEESWLWPDYNPEDFKGAVVSVGIPAYYRLKKEQSMLDWGGSWSWEKRVKYGIYYPESLLTAPKGYVYQNTKYIHEEKRSEEGLHITGVELFEMALEKANENPRENIALLALSAMLYSPLEDLISQ